MRTTINLEDDVIAEIERLRRDQGVGLSDAVNRLIRKAMTLSAAGQPYVHRPTNLGLRVDVANIGEVLELLDET